MTKINRSALVSHTAQQMYDLVNDVDSYPEYMHGCKAAQVISRSDTELVGKLTLSNSGMSHSFTTRNTMEPGRVIEMDLVEGPFRKFYAKWTFDELTAQASKVSLDMEFELNTVFFDFALESLFNSAAQGQMDSLVKRAKQVYG